MAATKRPALRKNDRVTLSRIKSVIPAYGGKPFVGREDLLTVAHLTGTGSKRNPWHVVVTDGTHFWHLEPDDVTRVDTTTSHSTMKSDAHRELNAWLDRNGYRHAHARVIHQEPTGRSVFAEHQRNHHITTSGRRALTRGQFALPPGREEKRRGIKGRLPIDTIVRARNALARASQMHLRGEITARQLSAIRHRVNRVFPEIHVSPIED